ncbi:MAG: hypothetical protein GY802_01185 [Gammaproteobacteria bacterium]|nr:hypothetical protein [Gammaproteobacteria bacterium]
MNDDDDSEFADLIPGVRRLRHDRINVYQHRKPKKPLPRQQDQAGVIPSNYPSEATPASASHFNTGMQTKLQRKIRQGQIRPEASLDLHGYRQGEALETLAQFIGDALQRRMRLVIVVHGQGYRSQSDAVLKPLVQRWLASQSQVLAWCPAQPRDGAAGASYVYLRTS